MEIEELVLELIRTNQVSQMEGISILSAVVFVANADHDIAQTFKYNHGTKTFETLQQLASEKRVHSTPINSLISSLVIKTLDL